MPPDDLEPEERLTVPEERVDRVDLVALGLVLLVEEEFLLIVLVGLVTLVDEEREDLMLELRLVTPLELDNLDVE